jgi:hypothetical protein
MIGCWLLDVDYYSKGLVGEAAGLKLRNSTTLESEQPLPR